MKKTIYAIATFAFALVGCTKEYSETYAPGDVVTINAQVIDTYTKVAADNSGSFSWQSGDKISILNASYTPYEFSKAGDGAKFTCTGFEGELGTIAYYPASDKHSNTVFHLASEFEWVKDATNMPMIGAVDKKNKTVSFKTAGAVIKLVCYNVAPEARKIVVSSDSKNLSGDMTISGGEAIETKEGSNAITITFGDSHPTTMVFYIPVPTGDLGKLSFVMQDGSGNNVSNVQETKSEITMKRRYIIAAPALNCGSGAILWSEDFSQYDANDIPSGKEYMSGSDISYSCKDGETTTKIFTTDLLSGGAASPELLISKKNGTFTVSDIPTNGAGTMILTFMTNKNLTLSSSTDGIEGLSSISSDGNARTVVISNTNNAVKFDIEFKNTLTSNARIDDLLLTVPGKSYTAPSITTTKESLSIPKAGGSDYTTFELTNPIPGESSSAVKATVEEGAPWLTANIDGTTLTVTAENNTGEERSAIVTLRATGASKQITVIQATGLSTVEVTLNISDYASAHDWVNGTQYTTINVDSNITATADGGGNTGKYYESGSNWRLYQGESATMTISAKSGYTIDKVNITYSVSNTGILKNGANTVNTGTDVTVNASSITFNVGNSGTATNGQVRVTSIYVKYRAS